MNVEDTYLAEEFSNDKILQRDIAPMAFVDESSRVHVATRTRTSVPSVSSSAPLSALRKGAWNEVKIQNNGDGKGPMCGLGGAFSFFVYPGEKTQRMSATPTPAPTPALFQDPFASKNPSVPTSSPIPPSPPLETLHGDLVLEFHGGGACWDGDSCLEMARSVRSGNDHQELDLGYVIPCVGS